MKTGLLTWIFVASAFLALAAVSAWAVSVRLLPVFRDSPSLSEAEVLNIFHEELLYMPPPSFSAFEKASGQQTVINVEKLLTGARLTEALIEAQMGAPLAEMVTLDWGEPSPLRTSVDALKRLATYDGDGWWAISFKDHTWRLNENTKEIVPVSAAARAFLAEINPPPPKTPDTFEHRVSSVIVQVDEILSDLAIMDIRFTQIAAKRPRARPVASSLLSTEELRRSLMGNPNDPFRVAREELDLLTAQAAELRWQLGEIERMRPAENLAEFMRKVDKADSLEQRVEDLQKELDELWTKIDELEQVVEAP